MEECKLKPRDAIYVVTAIGNNINKMLSNDPDFDTRNYKGIIIVCLGF
jgi:predicted nucleic acid-binding protein